MEPIFFPDYHNSIVSLSNSILKFFDCPTHHKSLPLLDAVFSRGYQNVVLILIDGMGQANIERLLSKESIIRKRNIHTLSSVFPPTTVAATTSLLSGKSPIQSGWLGWCQYVKEEDKSIVFFTNKDYYNEEATFDYSIADTYVQYESILSQVKRINPNVQTTEIFPAFRTPEHTTFEREIDTLEKVIHQKGSHFAYIYWDKLDSLMHEFGPGSIEVYHEAKRIETVLEHLEERLPKNTICLITADHGQVDVCPIDLSKYPALLETLEHMPSIESRATSFFVKRDQLSKFEQLFKEYFRDSFVLYSKADVLQFELFGQGVPHPKFDEFMGDYLAIAIDRYYFKMNHVRTHMRGQHAGLLRDEMLVPLLLFEKK